MSNRKDRKEELEKARQQLREEIQDSMPDGQRDIQNDTPAPASPSSALVRHRRLRMLRWVLLLALLGVVVYLVVQLFIILAPRMRTEVAFQDTMVEAMDVTGLVVLDSIPVYGGGGYLYYSVPAGQRVTPESEVALQFSSHSDAEVMDRLAGIDEEIQLLSDAQRAATEGGDLDALLTQQQTGVYSLISALESGGYEGVDAVRNDITLATNKIQISTGQAPNIQARIDQLAAEKATYEQQLGTAQAVTAPAAGYFVPSSQMDRVPLSYEEAAQLTPQQLQNTLQAQGEYFGGDVVGHVVQDYRWYFFTVVSAHDAEKFIEGDKSLQLQFPDAGEVTMPVTVNSVRPDENEEYAVVELYCEYISPEMLNLRVEDAKIIFREVKGIRIEKNALRLVDVPNEDGSVSTLRGVYVQFGNMVYFRRVEILLEDEFYMLLPLQTQDGVNEVELYDKVVVDSGGVELYDRKIL